MWALIAILILSIGYWSQVYKNYQTEEVGNLSVVYFLCMAIGFVILSIQAIKEGSFIFFLKQISVLVPTIIIIKQIIQYRNPSTPYPCECENELKPKDNFCSNCGKDVKKKGSNCHPFRS